MFYNFILEENLIHVYRLQDLLFPHSGSKYYWHYVTVTVLLSAFILIKNATFILKNNEKLRVKEGEDRLSKDSQNYQVGFRTLYMVLGFTMVLFGLSRPSRTVRNIFVDKVSKQIPSNRQFIAKMA